MEYSLRQRRQLWLYTFLCPAIDRFARIVRDIAPAEEIFDSPPEALGRIVGADTLARMRRLNSEEYIDALLERLRARSVEFVCRGDERYPACFEELADFVLPPELLFVRGNPELNVDRAIAVVGTRDCSPEGACIARSFARDFARAGAAVVSGMAVGIDAAATEGALDGGGRAIGVLACGVDVPYPAQNQPLARRLLESGGSLISEYMPGMRAHALYFPVRNRLIGALALGTLVVQAPERSGALNTAGHALNCGREVFVVPGSILDARFAGSNALLMDGAAPALTSFDVLAPLGLVGLDERERYSAPVECTAAAVDPPAPAARAAPRARSAAPRARSAASRNRAAETPAPAAPPADPGAARRALDALAPDERRVAELLLEHERSFDEIISQTDFDTARLNSLLTMLKIKRIIYETTGKHFRIDDALR